MKNAFALLLFCALAGCGGGGGSAAPLPTAAPTPSSAFIVLGDSISCGAFQGGTTAYNGGAWILDLPHSWPSVASALVGRPVINLSIAGGGLNQAATVINQIPPNTTTVVYAGGTNDIATWPTTTAALITALDKLLASVHAQAPNAQIVFLDVRRFSGIPNDAGTDVFGIQDSVEWSTLAAWNAHEKLLGTTVDIQDVDFSGYDAAGVLQYPDGVHPTIAQAQLLGQMMAPVLR